MEQRISIHEPALKHSVALSPRSGRHPNKENDFDGRGT